MNAFDLLIITILIFCIVRGVFRGLVKEISSLIGVLGGFYAGYTYYADVSKILFNWISTPSYRYITSFLTIFFLVFIIINIAGIIIKYLLNITFLNWIDRLFGAVSGIVKGILIVSVLLIVFTAFLPKGNSFIKNSCISPYVTILSENMARVTTKEIKQNFTDKIKELKKYWKIK